jgi:hypothetical protein
MAQIILHPREGRTPKDYALMYIGLGWKVFPVWSITSDRVGEGGEVGTCACQLGAECDRPAKHPIGDLVPNGVSDATSERAKVEAWWGRFPTASIGIATGAVSGITVVDADAGNGKPGLINLTRLFAPKGGVPKTFTVKTGGGGLHLYFKYDAALATGANVLAEAIDIRNDGGYVIAPPSLHKNGQYLWSEDRAELMSVPEWLLNTPREFNSSKKERRGRPKKRGKISLDKVQSMLAVIDPDDRDNWLKIGLILGREYIGSEAEGEAWAMYEAWSARSDKFDDSRAANIERMREQFYEYSQAETRAGAEPAGMGSIVYLARQAGWTPFGDRVMVNYEAGNESAMCSMLVEALVEEKDKNLFYNVMGEVREVLRAPVSSVRMLSKSNENGSNKAEYLMLRAATAPALQCALSEKAVIGVTVEGVPKAKPIPEALVSMILRGKSREFPPLSGIAEWPMVIDGHLLMKAKGYDEATGLYFDIDNELVIDERVTAEDGWAWIREELLADFPFENETHEAGALAMMLCMMQRPLMRTCPAFAAVAPQPGTGKSTLIEVAAMVVYGSPAYSHSYSSEEEELRKALHSLMIAKIPMVMFDNLKRGASVASDHLAKTITSEITSDRVLGSSETRNESNTLFITFTGNNIAFVRDMSSRVVTIRLDAKSANPIGRRFKHPDIRDWAYQRRSRFLSALVAIAKMADGERAEGGRPSRFDDYETLIVQPIKRVTGVDIRELDIPAEADAEEASLARDVLAILYLWQRESRESENGKEWKTSDILAAIDSRSFSDNNVTAIQRFAGTSRAWESDPVRTLGYALRSARNDYQYAPYLLTSVTKKDGVRWMIKKLDEAETEVRTDTF